jgi:hypothetical protein
MFTAEHDVFWGAARKALGDGAGTRALIEVLLLHRHISAEHVMAGLRAAVALGATNADVVAVEARKAAGVATRPSASQAPAASGVISLAARRLSDPDAVIAGLPPDTRPQPTVGAYDELLTRRQRAAGPTEDGPRAGEVS